MGVFDYMLVVIIIYTAVTFYLLWRVGSLEVKLLEYTADKTAEYIAASREDGGEHEQ